MNTMGFVWVMGILATVAITVLMYIFVLPEKKSERLPKIGKIIRDIFTFKDLFIEKIFQFLYVLSTVACVAIGAFMLLGFESYVGMYYSRTRWYGGYGILLMIGGPIALRIVFEFIMMFILLVKNVMQINQKIKREEPKAEVVEKPEV